MTRIITIIINREKSDRVQGAITEKPDIEEGWYLRRLVSWETEGYPAVAHRQRYKKKGLGISFMLDAATPPKMCVISALRHLETKFIRECSRSLCPTHPLEHHRFFKFHNSMIESKWLPDGLGNVKRFNIHIPSRKEYLDTRNLSDGRERIIQTAEKYNNDMEMEGLIKINQERAIR